MKESYRRIGVVVKPNPEVRPYLEEVVSFIARTRRELVMDPVSAEMTGKGQGVSREKIGASSDLLVVIGGDGTFLSVAKQSVIHGIPICGFNLGRLGFLTELNKESIQDSLDRILARRSPIARRKVLKISFQGRDYLAVNDVVLSKGNIARIIGIGVQIDHEELGVVKADGMILSTPTGSTGYSLSAGGPVVSPRLDGIIITPICAHSLTFRPLVVSGESIIRLSLAGRSEDVWITIDGQKVLKILSGQGFTVGVDSKELRMIVSHRIGYFQLLNEKLHWGA